jgi:Uma2 family endonuclease
MQLAPELGIPEVKPAIESVRGRWYQKLSPRTRHSLLQGRMHTLLVQWANGRGDVGPEWRFYLLPTGEKPSSLVPDVAYVANGRLYPEAGDARERPVLAPDIAVEILSPGDRKRLLETKIALYFGQGTALVIVVDPATRTVRMREPHTDETSPVGEVARSYAFPDLTIDVSALFARIV